MTKIRINKTIAKVEINRRIERGQQLINQLDDVGAIDSQEKFSEIHETQKTWSASNVYLLRRIFDDDSIAREYEGLGIETIDENQSLGENELALRKAIGQKVAWLRDLINRLDSIPQSELTPRRIPGINKGEIWVSEDFDEPLPGEGGIGAL